VDGHTAANFGEQSCTHTNRNGKQTWWAVDLGKYYDITEVTVYNRKDCCSERLSNFVVEVLDQHEKEVGTCGNGGNMARVESKTIKCATALTGQFVVIYLPTPNYLTLCEVKVKGTESAEQPKPLVNIALNKLASQSSTIHEGPASRAIDGKTSGSWHDKTCTHTQNAASQQGAQPWLKINLFDRYIVTHVKLNNRVDCCSERLSNAVVEVLGLDGQVVGECGNTGDMKGIVRKVITCEKPLTGAYVNIRQTNGEYLTLCEVQVNGDLAPPLPARDPIGCDFYYAPCGWNMGRWELRNRFTESEGTGPDIDAEGFDQEYGRFAFFEASYPVKKGDKAVAKSPTFKAGEMCLHFKAYLKGLTMGTLTVHTITGADKKMSDALKTIAGNMGDKWWPMMVNLKMETDFQVALVGTRGESWSSDMAIDIIYFTPGKCPTTDNDDTPAVAKELGDEWPINLNDTHDTKSDNEDESSLADEAFHLLMGKIDITSSDGEQTVRSLINKLTQAAQPAMIAKKEIEEFSK